MADRVLVICAHPDDVEYYAGGIVVNLVRRGYDVYYLVVTDGSKGMLDLSRGREELVRVREREQIEAAKTLGVREVQFLGYPDGELEYSLELRGELIRWVRKLRPSIIMGLDPWLPYEAHPDHRLVGTLTGEAVVFSGLPSFYKEHFVKGLETHMAKRIYFYSSWQPNLWVDISGVIEHKVQALLMHRSQIPLFAELIGEEGEQEEVEERIRRLIETVARREGEAKGLKAAESIRVMAISAGHLRVLTDEELRDEEARLGQS